MSIKSQKSLNDECSEIFERSYSVRSVSEDSSGEEDEECLSRELMNKMTPAVLSKLRRCFKKNKERNQSREIDRRVEEVMRAAAAEEGIEFAATATPPEDILWLDKSGFVTALDNIFGNHKYTPHAQKLFSVLDGFSSGKVWWKQVVARLVAAGAKKTTSRADVWTPANDRRIRSLEHCKRETIIKLVSIEREDSFCYVAVSKGGRIGIYSGLLKLLHSYELFYHRSGIRRRVKNCWITDAIYLNDIQYLIMSASDRSLTVYDATTMIHTPVFCITGLPNIPTCLAYSPSEQMSDNSELVFGTERGDLIRLRFLQPRVQLFHCKSSDNINYYFWMELSSPPHTSNCSITTWRRVHSRSVRRVTYTRNGDIIMSCSHDSAVSVRARHVPGKLDDYVFRVQRGVSCFHIVSPLHLLATGSCDGIVRLWETTQPMPYASLIVPSSPAVLDVSIIAAKEIVVAYCNNCTVHVWDMYEECLLQSIKLKFPFLGVLGKKVEFGAFSIHPGPARKKEIEDEPQDIPAGALSRRGSSVYQGSTGGLMLLPDAATDWQNRPLEDEPEYIRFNRSELLITCCDHVCTLVLSDQRGAVMSPPGDTLHPRRPSMWDMPDLSTVVSPRSSRSSYPSSVPSPRLLAPSDAEHTHHDLDTLLDNAGTWNLHNNLGTFIYCPEGLQGILEKDFVLMQGLKNDLNKKLADLEANNEAMTYAVNNGAPYLALQTYEPDTIPPVDDMTDEYRRVMKLFPASSTAPTPSGSETSTPRNIRNTRPRLTSND